MNIWKNTNPSRGKGQVGGPSSQSRVCGRVLPENTQVPSFRFRPFSVFPVEWVDVFLFSRMNSFREEAVDVSLAMSNRCVRIDDDDWRAAPEESLRIRIFQTLLQFARDSRIRAEA